MRTSHLRPYRPLAASLAALLLSTVVPRSAAAQAPEPAPPAASPSAEALTKARAALTAGDTAGACVLFEQSYQIGKSDDVLFELAACHEKLGKKTIAAAEYDQVAAAGGPRASEARARSGPLKGSVAGPAASSGPAESPQSPPTAEVHTVDESPPTRIGDFMDTRLSWTFGDDDVLHATGLAFPLSPNFSIGDRKQYRLFFDNLNSRFGGRENLTHLALYKKMPGFIKRLETEASLVIRFDIGALATNTNNLNQAIYDAGSYIRLFYRTSDMAAPVKTGLSLTFWPIDTDRFRLGYLYDLSWGGTNPYINQSIFPRIQGASPGAKVQYDGEIWNAYIGFKTASIVQVQQTLTPGTSEIDTTHVSETNFGFLAGGGVDLGDYLRVDVGGGYFQQGKFDLPDVSGKPVFTVGGSGRIFAHHPDQKLPPSIDFLLYKNDPEKPQQIFKDAVYFPDKTTWSASVEYDHLAQNLKNFDVTGATALQQAHAGALQANLASGFFRASVTGLLRDLPYVLRNQPSYIPFETIPKTAKTTNGFFFAAAADYYFEGPRLTPGIGGGLQFPATFQSTSTDSASAPINRTVVVREQGNIAILPVNSKAVPIVQARASLKWQASRILSAQVWIQYIRDNNATFVARDPSEGTVSLRKFIKPDFMGIGTSVQARF